MVVKAFQFEGRTYEVDVNEEDSQRIDSGYSWGSRTGQPVLFLHGLQDNSQSFEALRPLLPTSFYYIFLDLPGHGKSSHYQAGVPLFFLHYVSALLYVCKALPQRRVIVVGHSLGASLGLFFASLFPEYVEKLFLIDGLIPTPVLASQTLNHIQNYFTRLEALLASQKGREAPVYSYTQALQKVIECRPWFLEREAATLLVERSITPCPNGYRFSLDQRLKLGLIPTFDISQYKNIFTNVTCPVQILLASETVASVKGILGKYQKPVTDFLKGLKNYRINEVEGNHNAHLNHPERVAPHIVKFLVPQSSL